MEIRETDYLTEANDLSIVAEPELAKELLIDFAVGSVPWASDALSAFFHSLRPRCQRRFYDLEEIDEGPSRRKDPIGTRVGHAG